MSHDQVKNPAATLTVNVQEAKTHLSRLLEQAHAGEEIVTTNAGRPYAGLMPLATSPAQRRPGRLKGLVDLSKFFDALPDAELDAWERR